MTLIEFVTASIKRKSPNNVPVSHPKRGFDIIDQRALPLWKGWGWQEESWDIVVDPPVGAKPKRTRRAKSE